MRIGLVADTHMPGSIAELWPQAMAALAGTDLILHAGDLHTLAIVDALERIAPVHVARGNGDAGLEDARIRDGWLLEHEGVRIALLHHLPSPARQPRATLDRALARQFGGDPGADVVVFGHTHLEGIYRHDDRLYVNPGSPTLPRNQSVRFGTLGLLEVDAGTVRARVVQLHAGGHHPHAEVDPHHHAVVRDHAVVRTGD